MTNGCAAAQTGVGMRPPHAPSAPSKPRACDRSAPGSFWRSRREAPRRETSATTAGRHPRPRRSR
jgi:hypothetical protein